MSDTEPIPFRPRAERTPLAGTGRQASAQGPTAQNVASWPGGAGERAPAVVSFNRQELVAILNVYGRKVAAGEWRDYAMDFGRERAVFSIFRRASEVPLYRIEKNPKLARKQGAYTVVSATGLILKRGQELQRVLMALEPRVQPVI